MQNRSLFITGIGRGLGKATALLAARRGYHVVGTVRNEADLAAVSDWGRALQKEGASGRLNGALLDVLNINTMPEATLTELENADVLINNAGWGAEIDLQDHLKDTVDRMDNEIFLRAVAINATAPRELMKIAIPRMKERGWGRIVNVSSARACISEIIGEDSIPAYRMSKLLLNGITALAGNENRGTGVLINSLCPGWCKTDMGGPKATDSPEQGAARILSLAELADDGPTGTFFMNDQPHQF